MSDLSPATTRNLADMLSGGRTYAGGKGPSDRAPNINAWRAAGMLKPGTNSVSQKAVTKALMRTASRSPEVMVKITGKQGSAGHAAANFLYIGRTEQDDPKEIELETDEDGRTITTIAEAREEAKRWGEHEMTGQDRRKGAVSRAMVLSAPEGSDPQKVFDAARGFARQELAATRYVMALHTDQKHPHVHITYAIRDKEGNRSYPNRDDLQRYRQTFARELRARGIEANATPRKARGVVAERVRTDSRQAQDHGKPLDRDSGAGVPKGRAAYLTAQRGQRDVAIDTYRCAIADLDKSSDPEMREVAKSLSVFVKSIERERAADPQYQKDQARTDTKAPEKALEAPTGAVHRKPQQPENKPAQPSPASSDRPEQIAPEFVTIGGEKLDISREPAETKEFMRELDINRERAEAPTKYELAGVGQGGLAPSEIKVGGETINLAKIDRASAQELVDYAADRARNQNVRRVDKPATLTPQQDAQRKQMEKSVEQARATAAKMQKGLQERIKDRDRDKSRSR